MPRQPRPRHVGATHLLHQRPSAHECGSPRPPPSSPSGASHCRDLLQNGKASFPGFQCTLQAFHLALDAANPGEERFFVRQSVCHKVGRGMVLNIPVGLWGITIGGLMNAIAQLSPFGNTPP